MHRFILVTAAALALFTAVLSDHAAAMTVSARSVLALPTAKTGTVQMTPVACGPQGCKHWRRWHYSGPAAEPYFPPVCPDGYHYACQRGPLGYGQCACWPYPRPWLW